MEPRAELKFLNGGKKKQESQLSQRRSEGSPHAQPALRLLWQFGLESVSGGGGSLTPGGGWPEMRGGQHRTPACPGPRLQFWLCFAAANSPILIRTLLFHFNGLVELAIGGAVLGVGSLHGGCAGAPR